MIASCPVNDDAPSRTINVLTPTHPEQAGRFVSLSVMGPRKGDHGRLEFTDEQRFYALASAIVAAGREMGWLTPESDVVPASASTSA